MATRRGGGARERRGRSRRWRRTGVAVFPADDAFTPLWRQLAGARRGVDLRAATAQADVTRRCDVAGRPLGAAAAHAAPARPTFALRVAGAHNVQERAGRRAPARWPPACRWRAIVRGPGSLRAGQGPLAGCSAGSAAAARSRWSTTATTPTRIRCAPPSTCWPRCPARAGWCWATWARSATRARQFHAEVGAYARAARHRAAVDRGRAVRARGRGLWRRRAALRRRRRAARRAGRGAARRASVLVKGSRFMRMERVGRRPCSQRETARCCLA